MCEITLEFHDLKGPAHFFSIPTQQLLKKCLAFLQLYQHAKYQLISSIHFWDIYSRYRAVEKGGRGHRPRPFIFWSKSFFHIKQESIRFLHVNNKWDFSLFIEEDVSDKIYIAFSEFVVLAVNCAITVTNNEFVIFVFNKNLCKNE